MRGGCLFLCGLVLSLCGTDRALASFGYYAQIDGAFYSIPDVTFDGTSNAWLLPTVPFWGCNPQSGSFQPYSSMVLFYDPNYDYVFLKTASYQCGGVGPSLMCFLTLVSTSGDIVCNGALLAPPDRIFGNDFEISTDHVFADGFQ